MGTPPAEAAGEPPAEAGHKAGGEAAGAPRSREASQQPQQGSREASQQPQTAAAAAAQQPASSSQLAGGSKLSAGSGGSLKRPRGSGAKGGEENKVVVYGKEVVGRQVGVWSAKAADWPKAAVAQYNAGTGQHLLRYLERPPGSIKHHEEWVCLARTRFQWLAGPPPQAKPNPSWDGAPRGDEAVGYKVRCPCCVRCCRTVGCCCRLLLQLREVSCWCLLLVPLLRLLLLHTEAMATCLRVCAGQGVLARHVQVVRGQGEHSAAVAQLAILFTWSQSWLLLLPLHSACFAPHVGPLAGPQ